MPVKRNIARERRYISEFMFSKFRRGNYQLNIPIGPIPQELVEKFGTQWAAAQFRPSRRRVDALGWTPHQYILVEAKIRDPLPAIGQLLTYKALLLRTPDLPDGPKDAIDMWLVCPWALDWIKIACQENGIKLFIYWRDWIADYVAEFQNYFTAEYRRNREEVLRMRQVLGVD